MVDFGYLYLLWENNKDIKKKLNKIIDNSKSLVGQLKLYNKGLNRKKYFSMLKQKQLNNSSKKITNIEENFPNLSPYITPKKKLKKTKKINYFCLFNTLKSESIKKPLFN